MKKATINFALLVAQLFFVQASHALDTDYSASCAIAIYENQGSCVTTTLADRTASYDLDSGTVSRTYSGTKSGYYCKMRPGIVYFDASSNAWLWAAVLTSEYYTAERLEEAGFTQGSPTSIQAVYGLQCPNINNCSPKANISAGYSLATYTEGGSPNLSNQCVDGCQVTATNVGDLGPCVNSSCAASILYTYTGLECSDGEEDVADIDDDQPSTCYDKWIALKNTCGGAANVGTFDWSTCTGDCSTTDCSSAWATLTERCGGESNIVNWDGKQCSGACKTDDTPDVTDGDAPPDKVTTTTTTNDDGTSSTTTTTTYNIDETSYTTTTTTTYDADGNATGTSTTETQDVDDEESFGAITSDSFGEGYMPSTDPYDIPTRFNTFLTNVQSSGLFSFSSDFFNSLPSGGSSVYTIEGGDTFGGTHTIDLSETMSGGLAVVKSVLLALFGFLSIRAIIMKR